METELQKFMRETRQRLDNIESCFGISLLPPIIQDELYARLLKKLEEYQAKFNEQQLN